jgi:hypothetical protein
MANRLQKQPVLTYVPAVAPVPARDAYCTTENVITGYTTQTVGGTAVFIPAGSGGGILSGGGGSRPVYRDVLNTTTGTYERKLVGWWVVPPVTSRRVPIYQAVRTCYPAREAVIGQSARIDTYANNGWNGGARSRAKVPVGGYLQVKLPDTPYGVEVGLSDGQFDHSYGHPSHALVARPSGITPIERGLDMGPEQPLGSTVRIIRLQDGVRMMVDDQVIYDSETAIAGAAYGDVTLYSTADFVDEPVIGAYHETGGVAGLSMVAAFAETAGGVAAMTTELEALVLLNGQALTGGVAAMQLRSQGAAHGRYEITGAAELGQGASLVGVVYADASGVISSGVASYGHGKLCATGKGMMGVSGTAKPMYGRGAFPPASSAGRLNRAEVVPFQAVGVYPPGIGRGMLKRTLNMQGAGVLAMAGKGSETVQMGGSAPAATVYRAVNWWEYMPSWMLDVGQMVGAIDSILLEGGALFVIAESLQVGETIDLFMVVNFEFVGVSTDASLAFIVQMAIDERVRLSSAATDARKEALQYAVNAVTGALSTYRNFGFKQFARMAGDTYAITDAGLFRLGGEGDDGETLNAFIDFGSSDFGTSRSKRMNSVYAGIATDGTVYLRVSGDDGTETVYRAVGDGVERRARTAKGLTARHWRVRLELADASYAELDNIEIELGVSQRRLR